MTTITVTRPDTIAAPRGALWAAEAAAQTAHALASVGEVFQALGTAWRARHEEAERCENAAAVRRLADTWRDVDPSFAADLYAAADRHQS